MITKRRSAQSAFFNLRVFIGLLMALTGVILPLSGLATFAVPAASIGHTQPSYTATSSIDPLIPAGFDCSKIHELGIDMQTNLRAGAIMIFCGLSEGGISFHDSGVSPFVQKLIAPASYGGTDVDLITGPETFPNVTQSTTFTTANPDNPNQIVVAYNDSRGSNANPPNGAGASVSTDGGNTFPRLTTASGQSPFPNCGYPIILYNKPIQTWFVVCLDAIGGAIGVGL